MYHIDLHCRLCLTLEWVSTLCIVQWHYYFELITFQSIELHPMWSKCALRRPPTVHQDNERFY